MNIIQQTMLFNKIPAIDLNEITAVVVTDIV